MLNRLRWHLHELDPSFEAASSVRERAGIDRFRSAAAYARHNGTVPLPVSSAGGVQRRLSRTGNRQLNAALYRIALTQSRWHPQAQALLARARRRATPSVRRCACASPGSPTSSFGHVQLTLKRCC